MLMKMGNVVTSTNVGMSHEENSGTTPTASVLTNQKSVMPVPPAPFGSASPASAYPPSAVATSEQAHSLSVPPYVLLHIEDASTETTEEKSSKIKATMTERDRVLRKTVVK